MYFCCNFKYIYCIRESYQLLTIAGVIEMARYKPYSYTQGKFIPVFFDLGLGSVSTRIVR